MSRVGLGLRGFRAISTSFNLGWPHRFWLRSREMSEGEKDPLLPLLFSGS